MIFFHCNMLLFSDLPLCWTDLHAGECGPGSYYSAAKKLCVPCDVGSYQPRSGQSSCLTCPHEMITYGITYQPRSGQSTCLTCPHEMITYGITYQPRSGQSSCLTCPHKMITYGRISLVRVNLPVSPVLTR